MQIANLTRESFRAKVGAQQIKVSSARVEAGPRRVVLLVNAGGSVNKENRSLHEARLVARNLLLNAPPELQSALVVFSDHVVDSVEFSQSPTEAPDKLAHLENVRGHRALFDSLIYAATLFGPGMPGDSVYLISGGGEIHSHSQVRDVKWEFATRGIRLFTFRLGGDLYLTPEEMNEAALIRELAKATGGASFDVGSGSSDLDQKALSSALQRVYDETVRFYRLDVELPSNQEKQHGWDLEVLDESGNKRKDVTVFYSRELPRCSIVSLEK